MVRKKALILHYIIGSLIGILILTVILTNLYLSREKSLENKFYPNIFIDNLAVGGKTKDAIITEYDKKNNVYSNLKINVHYNDSIIATLSAQQINLHSNGADVAETAYLVGRTPHTTTRILEKLSTIYSLKKYTFTTHTVYDKGVIKDLLSDFADQYNKPAKNALFTFQDGRVVTFRPDEKGNKIDDARLIGDLDHTVAHLGGASKTVELVLKDIVIQPEISLSEANKFGIEELIGEGKSDYSGSIPGRVHNVQLAASKFHGVLIPKDKEFSFNEIIGDISAQTGYEPAYIIQNGRTVLGDGGGVCQVSTTLFRAALNSGLPITQRTAHAYRVHYYENDNKPGLDATVFAPYVDLRFKNDTPASILIQTEINEDNNLLSMKFYGKKDNRRAELSPITVYDEVPPAPAKYEDDPTLPRGVTKQVDFSAWGAKSIYTYKVYKGDQLAINKQFLSVYRPWQAVYLNGTKD